MLFNDFVYEYNLKNEATSRKNFQQILSTLFLVDIGIYLRDGPFRSDIGIVNLHIFKGPHWGLYIHESYFDSYGFTPRNKLSKFPIKKGTLFIFRKQISRSDK